MSDTTAPEGQSGRAVAFGLVGIVMMLILPIPPMLLDVLLTLSITFGLIVFLMAINFGNPVEFSTFPSVLLVATMFRLGLNVASTRLILLRGHEGPDAAGSLIQAFGAFVVGGSYIVGIIVFIILVIINFKVITAGASRISEVAARFTLDAMPGKQMAIDNELAGGHISEIEARTRRKAISDEADFYGAMDGANKFVKGDAVAGLIVTAINIVGGIIVAVTQMDMSLGDAAQTYTILTVGDGLVSQIPSLLVSVAAGLIASRSASGKDLGSTLVGQFLDRPQPLMVAGVALAAMGFIPGMPTWAFLLLAGSCVVLSRRATKRIEAEAAQGAATGEADNKKGEGPERLHDLLALDLLSLEVGFDLVPLVDRTKGGELLKRVTGIRKQLVPELGIVVPPIRIRDNLQLPSTTYRLLLSGTAIGEGSLLPARLLAINPGNAMGDLRGEKTTEPAFGMPATWVASGDRERAELLGYTVVDPATVAATHLTELLKQHAPELLGRAEAQELIDAFAEQHPKLVEEVIPNLLPLGDVIAVLKNLLAEGVSVRDLRTILEALADHAGAVKDTTVLTERVRQTLSRQLTRRFVDGSQTLHAMVLAPDAEMAMRGAPAHRVQGGMSIGAGSDGNALAKPMGPDPSSVPAFIRGIERAVSEMGAAAHEPLLVTAPDIRRTVADLAARHAPGLAVLSYRELDPRVSVKTLSVVKLAA